MSRTQICKQLGGTIDDSELVEGMVFEKGAQKGAGGPTRIENAKVGGASNFLLALFKTLHSRCADEALEILSSICFSLKTTRSWTTYTSNHTYTDAKRRPTNKH